MNKYAPTFTIALLACWACLGPTTVGHAQTGNPQIDQYTEHVPDSGGGQPTGGNGNGNGGGGDAGSGGGGEPDEPVLEQEQSSELDDLGQDGAGVADLAEDTSPDASGAGGSGGGGDDSGNGDRSPDQASSEPGTDADSSSPSMTSSGSDGNDGLGVLLPLIIGSLALGGLGLAVWRQRAAGTPA